MKKKLCVFDIEVLPNCFICCCKIAGEEGNIKFEISARAFQLAELIAFFRRTDLVFVGYNCQHYDTPIINMLIDKYSSFSNGKYMNVTNACYKLSSSIIGGSWAASEYKWLGYFNQIDLMTMMASKALRVGLKSLQVTMCYHNVQEMHVDWNQFIEPDDIDQLTFYCYNDIGSTYELLTLLVPDIRLRMAIQSEFKIKCLSKDGVGIGVDIFTRYICEKLEVSVAKELMNYRDNYETICVKDFLLDEIQFKTPALQEVRKFYENLVLDREGKGKARETSGTVIINNLQHSYGIGGLHSVNRPAVHIAGKGWIIRDSDVASMYPTMSDMWEFAPKGMKEAFLYVLRLLKALRLEAKKNKDATKDKTYKLALNAILGHLRNEYGPYYAPEANIGICVNGQLFLLMLIEECEMNGIEVISSNTDGITVKMKVEQEPLYNEICERWQKLSRMELEHVDYEKIVIVAVNDYIAFKAGYWTEKDGVKEWVKGWSDVKEGATFPSPKDWIEYNYTYVKIDEAGKLIDKYVKMKGMFVSYSRLGKGLDSLIVAKSLVNYFGKGIPIEQTIRESRDIWDFIKFQKIGKQYEVMWNGEEQQHINRFYVSKKGAYLFKRKTEMKWDKKTGVEKTVHTDANVLAGWGVQLFNTYKEVEWSEYEIDYRYYVSQANKILSQLESKQTTLF